MRLVRILDDNENEQTFLAHLIIKFEKINNDVTGLVLEFPLHKTNFKAYMNDDDLIDAIYGEEDDAEGDYKIIDCRPPDIKNQTEVVANRPDDDGGLTLGEKMDLAVRSQHEKGSLGDSKNDEV